MQTVCSCILYVSLLKISFKFVTICAFHTAPRQRNGVSFSSAWFPPLLLSANFDQMFCEFHIKPLLFLPIDSGGWRWTSVTSRTRCIYVANECFPFIPKVRRDADASVHFFPQQLVNQGDSRLETAAAHRCQLLRPSHDLRLRSVPRHSQETHGCKQGGWQACASFVRIHWNCVMECSCMYVGFGVKLFIDAAIVTFERSTSGC